MSRWKNYQAPTGYDIPKLIDGTNIMTYHCDNCDGPILATGVNTSDKFLISIKYIKYCPHCGIKMEAVQMRDKVEEIA